jgi:GTP-binding protein YchF
MRLGLVGLPQVGKRTLFTLLTGQSPGPERGAEAVPGLAEVRDERFNNLVKMYSPKKRTPAQIEFALLPDLETDVERNRTFFKLLERVDVICYVARAFEDDTVFHTVGDVNAKRDIASFAEELELMDLLFIEKRLERLEKETGKKTDPIVAAQERAVLEGMQAHLEEGRTLFSFEVSEEDHRIVGSYPFLTDKPVVVIVNVADEAATTLPAGLVETFAPRGFQLIPVSAKVEQEISELDAEERTTFLTDLGIEAPAIDRLTRMCYEALGLISFFTVGEDEVRAWTIKRGSSAPQAGRAIHKDIEKGFIRTEVINYEDLITLGSEKNVKENGRLMQKGRDHVVEDGEIHHFLFKV